MELTEISIPIVDIIDDTSSATSVPIDFADPRFHDPLVRVSEYNIASESFYAIDDGSNSPYNTRIAGSLSDVWCRMLVAEKLECANRKLRRYGAELFVLDGYRPIVTQAGLWSFFSERAIRIMPTATHDERKAWVLKYVSDPGCFDLEDPASWPAHSTGGAIDLTLRSLRTCEELDMGARFDGMSKLSRSDAYERMLCDGKIGECHEALLNRRMLYWSMNGCGFENYPYEFWHFDWGNQLYVRNSKNRGRPVKDSAWYGYIEAPE